MTKTVCELTPNAAIDRLRQERDDLIRLCEAQRRKLERQKREIDRLRARLKEPANE